MSNTVAGRRKFDNSQECIAKKRQRRRHANENTLEQNASIGEHTHRATNCIPPAEVALNLAVGHFERKGEVGPGVGGGVSNEERERVFEYQTVFEVRHDVEPVALLCP